jgi:hypothetical protein
MTKKTHVDKAHAYGQENAGKEQPDDHKRNADSKPKLGPKIKKQNRIERLDQVVFEETVDRFDPSGQGSSAVRWTCRGLLGQEHLAIHQGKPQQEAKQILESSHGGLLKHPIDRFEKHFSQHQSRKITLKTKGVYEGLAIIAIKVDECISPNVKRTSEWRRKNDHHFA